MERNLFGLIIKVPSFDEIDEYLTREVIAPFSKLLSEGLLEEIRLIRETNGWEFRFKPRMLFQEKINQMTEIEFDMKTKSFINQLRQALEDCRPAEVIKEDSDPLFSTLFITKDIKNGSSSLQETVIDRFVEVTAEISTEVKSNGLKFKISDDSGIDVALISR